MSAWQPILTPNSVILTFAAVGAVFLLIGILVLIASGDVRIIQYVVHCSSRTSIGCGGHVSRLQGFNTRCRLLYSRCKLNFDQLPGRRFIHGGIFFLHSCNFILLSVQIPEDMKQPIYMYYQLKNFYQNHRRYVKYRFPIEYIMYILNIFDLAQITQ